MRYYDCRSLFLSCLLGVTAGLGLFPLSPALVMVQASELGSQKPQEGVIKTCTGQRIDLGAPQLTDADLKALTSCSSQVTPQLLEALKSQDWKVKVIAAHTLGLLGTKAQAAISALSDLLQDENPDVRFVAAQALGEIGTAAVVPALTQALQDKDENVRVSAVTAFQQLRGAAKQAKPTLIAALWDGNWYVRSRAAAAIAKLGLEATDIPNLMKDEVSRETLISVVPAIYPPARSNLETIPLFFIQGLQHKDPNVRENAAIALGAISITRPGYVHLDKITDALLGLLQEQEPQLRQSAANALGWVLDGYGRKSDLESFEKKKTAPELGELPYTRRIANIEAALVSSLQDEDSGTRQAAAESLESLSLFKVSSPKVILALLAALQDSEPQVRQSVTASLRSWSEFLKHHDYGIPNLLKNELSNKISLALVQALADEDAIIRNNAVKFLSSKKLFPRLIEIIEDKGIRIELRRSAIATLWQRLDQEAHSPEYTLSEKEINPLIQALQDPSLEIRQQAAIALIKIGKLDSKRASKIYAEGLKSANLLAQLDAITGLKDLCPRKGYGEQKEPEESEEQKVSIYQRDCTDAKLSLPSLLNYLKNPVKPLRYSAAFAVIDIDSSYKEPLNVIREILLNETDHTLRENAYSSLGSINSQKVDKVSILIETSRLSDKPLRYIRACSKYDDETRIFDDLKAYSLPLLLKGLKDENVRFLSAESFHRLDAMNALTLELKRNTKQQQISPVLDEIFNLKNQDVRRSIVYALGVVPFDEDPPVDSQRKEVINILMGILNDTNDDLDVRWMAATSLQSLGINVEKLVNLKKIRNQLPSIGRVTTGFVFNRYSGQFRYDYSTGCGAGLGEIYGALINLLNRSKSKQYGQSRRNY